MNESNSNSQGEETIQDSSQIHKNALNQVNCSYEFCKNLVDSSFEQLSVFFSDKNPTFITRDMLINIIKNKLNLKMTMLQATEALIFSNKNKFMKSQKNSNENEK